MYLLIMALIVLVPCFIFSVYMACTCDKKKNKYKRYGDGWVKKMKKKDHFEALMVLQQMNQNDPVEQAKKEINRMILEQAKYDEMRKYKRAIDAILSKEKV